MFDIDFYRLSNGKAPVEVFLDGLNIKMRNKALDSLMILKEFGNTLREPHSKYVGDGIFVKKTRKTPKAEIELAKKYKKDYEYRTEKEGNYGGRSSEVFGKTAEKS